MPSPKTKIDLKPWDDFRPGERPDDHEFNLLLYKFKSLYNEVRDFQRANSDGSASEPNGLEDRIIDNSVTGTRNGNIGSISIKDEKNRTSSSSLSPESNGSQSVISLRKKFFQQHQQESGPPPMPRDLSSLSSRLKGTNTIAAAQKSGPLKRSNESSHHENEDKSLVGRISQHYSSSHNLTSSVSIDIVSSPKRAISRPEVKQHNSQQTDTRLVSMSKSTERLDSVNNNHITLGVERSSGLPIPVLERQTAITNLSNEPYVRSRRDLNDDDVIYDAVSPDDLGAMPDPSSYSFNDKMPPIPCIPSQASKIMLESSRGSLILNNLSQSKNKTSSIKLPPKNNKSSSVQPPNLFNDSDQPGKSFSSSILLDSSMQNHDPNNSSLSLAPNSSSFKSQDFGNYVNIDFFLKRSQSPSFDDGLEDSSDADNHGGDDEDDDDDDDEEEDTTQMSHSLSTDQICEDLKQLSPRDLARKLSIVNRDDNRVSSGSITPASSNDLLDDNRSPSSTIQNQLSSTASTFSRHFENFGPNKFNSFMSPQHNQSSGDKQSREPFSIGSLSTNRDSNDSRGSLNNSTNLSNPRALDMIREGQYHSHSHKTQTIPSRQSAMNRESNQQLDQLLNQGPAGDGSNSSALAEAHTTMRSFLSELNLSPVDDVFEDKAQRRIVKESFAVEFCGRRKLRHLFLFNDVIVCAKYQASSKQKFTFDVKWYLNLSGVTVSDMHDVNSQVKLDLESIENQILAIRTNLMLLRGRMQQIKRSKDKKPSKIIKKLKKKRTELEAELVLLLPHLPLVIKHINGKKFLFFLSSNFDRNQWIESINYLQSQLPSTKSATSSPSSSELQAWIQTCRKNLNPSLGTFLLRSNCDDDLLYGDLYINLDTIRGIPKPGHYYFCFEVDSYGHFSQKASSVVLRIDETNTHDLNDEYVFPLDGAHTLRILLYEDQGLSSKPSVVGKAHVELSRAWCLDKPVERHIEFNSNCGLTARLSYSNSELWSMRIPHVKLCPTFGFDITQVCKKEKTQVPLLIQLCVHEVERRGMREIGIYRMSGTSTDIQRLKKAFDTNPYVAELLLRDIDINSVTGFLKTYLREMPEGLFINKLYPKFVAAFNLPKSQSVERTKRMIELYHKVPATNQQTIAYLVEHLVKVNRYENYNKMSLTNLATVLGPNILRPPTNTSTNDSSDPFTAVVIGSMSQAGILYFFLDRRANNLPLAELDVSEASATSHA